MELYRDFCILCRKVEWYRGYSASIVWIGAFFISSSFVILSEAKNLRHFAPLRVTGGRAGDKDEQVPSSRRELE